MTEMSIDTTIDQRLVDELTAHGPTGWRRLDAVFAMTVVTEAADLVYSVASQRMSVRAPEAVLTLVRRLRTGAAAMPQGPWWRMLLIMNNSGEMDVTYDYGAEPFPPEQLFAPEAYRADLAAFPRDKLPVWLGAYLGHEDRQQRTVQQAAAGARADWDGQVWATLAEHEFPPLPMLLARWTTIAAAFVAARSDWGPRMLPSAGVFEGDARSGSTVHVLPGDRAVLSGGVWNAPSLDAVYNGGEPMPKLFAGAPDWVANPVLNPRAAAGLLSFCYWWEAGHWYRGQSPSARECAEAVPGVWSADSVSAIIAGLAAAPGSDISAAATALVSSAEAGRVTREDLAAVFGDNERHDIDGALYQYSIMGLAPAPPRRMPERLAIARVRDYIIGNRYDTTGYPLSELVAHRISAGWMVHVPVPEGEISIGRAIFYIADDGVVEQSSSSVPPAKFVVGFEERFSERRQSAL
ncbi:hypothetical protein OG563_42875 [Nocardia vinacea]|uniref:Uncharacterized protein n=1 Tax=Nocardia vinacea TaxID=96468 RepID=A0ABZ1YR68_9NOCA|nr:hypothetical protein [Nocardia vinacea]